MPPIENGYLIRLQNFRACGLGMGELQKVWVLSELEHVVFPKVRVSSELKHLMVEHIQVQASTIEHLS